MNEAIKESITEEEKTDIAEHLGIVPADTIATIGRIGFYRDRLASTLGTITL